MRVWSGLALVLLLALTAATAGCSREGGPAAADLASLDGARPGPFRVGHSVEQVPWNEAHRTLPVQVWYPVAPAATGKAVRYLALLPGSALEGAPIHAAGTRYPLIVFSHANMSLSIQNYPNCEHLASHGYVVAAPSHVGNTFLGRDLRHRAANLENRPRDASAVIDWMLAGPYAASIDPESIGVMGHSYGAYTAISLAGAVAHLARYAPLCIDPPEFIPGCGLTGVLVNPIETIRYRDTRVKAAVAVSPIEYEFWRADGLAEVEIPLMVMSGTTDDKTPHLSEAVRTYEALPRPKILLTFEGVDHFGFSFVGQRLPGVGSWFYSDGVDPKRVEASMNRYLTAFFGLYLKRESEWARAFDTGEGTGVPGLRLEAEL